MIFRMIMVEEFSEEGAIWKIGENEYIVQKYIYGEDDLYWTDSLEEAHKEFMGEEEEELVDFKLHEGDKLIDLMIEHEALSLPRLRTLMRQQGFYMDKQSMTIVKRD